MRPKYATPVCVGSEAAIAVISEPKHAGTRGVQHILSTGLTGLHTIKTGVGDVCCKHCVGMCASWFATALHVHTELCSIPSCVLFGQCGHRVHTMDT
jgi:hypothetical protein